MAIIEVNVAGLRFTHGGSDRDTDVAAAGKSVGWRAARITMRPFGWHSALLRRPRAA